MNTQHNKKNRITILAILAMSVVPFAIAWYLAENPEKVKLGTNKGDLITPPVTTEYSEFSGYDAFTSDNLQELKGHWVLINLVPQNQCRQACEEALHKTRQITLMMGKDISRIRRVSLMYGKTDAPVYSGEWQADAHLLKTVASAQLREKLVKINPDQLTDGVLLLMDPLGNLMMKYAAGYDPYQVKNDLGKLLRISQIG